MKVLSWNELDINDGTNYSSVLVGRPLLWDSQAQLVSRNDARPGISNVSYEAVRIVVEIAIEGSDTNALRTQLAQWFSPRDKTSKALYIQDDDGSNQRYLMCICEGLRPRPNIGRLIFAASLVLDGFGDPDGRWRKPNLSHTWTITGTGDTTEIENNGDDIAYPVFIIEPTSAKTGDYAYKKWASVIWGLDVGVANYSIDITGGGFDTAALVTATKMQADGDDLRVQVDGLEVNRWLYGINTTTTKVWANLDFQPRAKALLETGFSSGDTVLTLDVNADGLGLDDGWFDLFPNSGVLLIGSEAFTYTGKNASLFRFTGVRRAQRGTTAAAHSAADTVHWIQHDVYILYGNSTATAPEVDADYEPMFSKNSTNTSWVYEEFYDWSHTTRPGRWAFTGEGTDYGGNQGTTVNPFDELGISRSFGMSDAAVWYTFNPCEITNANFTNGEKYALTAVWLASIDSSIDGSSWTEEYAIPAPSVDSTWESWSRNEALTTGSIYVRMFCQSIFNVGGYGLIEADDVTLTLNSSNTPTVSLGGEQGNYQLNCTITNNTTGGDAIQIAYTTAVNGVFRVDTDAKTLTDMEDDSSQFQALTLVGDPRRDWIPLRAGTNEFQFDDTGTVGVEITVQWSERYFD